MSASHLAGRTHGTRPTAEQVVDGPDQGVLLDLTPNAAAILGDLAKALTRAKRGHLITVLGNTNPTSREHTLLLQRILDTPGVLRALEVDITPAAADDLAEELDHASLRLDECDRDGCDSLATDGMLCLGHREAADTLRAVV